jgi:hypothetical protein
MLCMVCRAQFRPGGLNSNLITALICTAGSIPLVALIVEHVVSERISSLRNVLTVMGCDVKSYWLGTLSGVNRRESSIYIFF